ncbi:hypothetical protein RJ639_005025 [Escallonia herrerae]|uniref:Uncharacterized protein n=1 Tax=Escallonia herrerae TaxID=1293975 RepID=A0AA89B2H8_9ASTE|nr:hypothetical protein RJ639_005025 [Escallonia herrerae]
MVSLVSKPTSIHSLTPYHPLFLNPNHPHHRPPPHFKPHPPKTHLFINSTQKDRSSSQEQLQQPPRTLFPGGYKRPEVKVPGLVLQLNPEEVLEDKSALNAVDDAVSKWVGIVVLNGGEGSGGGKLYEAGRLLKSVIRDRAYLMVTERVDIAAAVNACGIVLSDQGIQCWVKSESVVLPLVARIVQTPNAAVNASSFEGADFLIYGVDGKTHLEDLVRSVFDCVKIPTFLIMNSLARDKLSKESSELLKSGASGLVISLQQLRLFGDGALSKLFNSAYASDKRTEETPERADKLRMLDIENGSPGKKGVSGFTKLEDRERKFIEKEKLVLSEALDVLQRAAPLMEEVSLLVDAVSQLDEPFLLVIVMIIVDTPGTNVILQRQQCLTEEFVPRADLLLFVISADRPKVRNCSVVAFLCYTQQWKKKVVFVLNKSDIYQNATELLNTESVALYPVSARSALEAKLSAFSDVQKEHEEIYGKNSHWRTSSFYELENFLNSFLDGSTSAGIERIKLKLETPIRIAEQLLSSCQKLVRQECQEANQDLKSVNDVVHSVKEYKRKMESESISWKRQSLSLINTTQAYVVKLVGSTLQLSNLDLVTSYVFKGEKSDAMPAASSVRNDIIGPALSEAQKLLGQYKAWLQSSNAHEGRLYKENFENRWPSFVNPQNHAQFEIDEFFGRKFELSSNVMENFSAAAASKLFEQEIREVFLGTFGGLGAAGLSASLLTSVLPTTLEDLLALGLCSAGGLVAISRFPARRQQVVDKVKRTADALARELEEAMEKDLLETTESLENFVKLIGKPYQDSAQSGLGKLLRTQDELTHIEEKLKALQIEIQNFHILR